MGKRKKEGKRKIERGKRRKKEWIDAEQELNELSLRLYLFQEKQAVNSDFLPLFLLLLVFFFLCLTLRMQNKGIKYIYTFFERGRTRRKLNGKRGGKNGRVKQCEKILGVSVCKKKVEEEKGKRWLNWSKKRFRVLPLSSSCATDDRKVIEVLSAPFVTILPSFLFLLLFFFLLLLLLLFFLLFFFHSFF